jgi:hypothetical protein
MRGECVAGFFNRFDQCAAKFFVLEMRAHGIDKSLPELPAAFFMNGLVAYHGKLMRPGRDENEHGIALARFVHAESMKFFLRCNQWIGTQLAALNINPDLTGGFRFRFPNRPNDSIVFEPTEKFLRSHLGYQLEPAPPPPKLPSPPLNPLDPPPPDDQPPPPPPIGKNMGPPPRDE